MREIKLKTSQIVHIIVQFIQKKVSDNFTQIEFSTIETENWPHILNLDIQKKIKKNTLEL